MLSPDGHCRPFDADANGTLFSNGVGVVALKRLEEPWPTATRSTPSCAGRP